MEVVFRIKTATLSEQIILISGLCCNITHRPDVSGQPVGPILNG
jgi:hypothetical protein